MAGTNYSFTVTARDAAGNESRSSQPVTLTMPAGEDLAQGKPVTVSSYSEPNTPALAVDGDLSTRWAQGLGLPDPSWIQVDLGRPYDLTGVITTFELASGYRYRLEASTDEIHWTTVEDHTAQATTRGDQLLGPVRAGHRTLRPSDRHRFQRQRRQHLRDRGLRNAGSR